MQETGEKRQGRGIKCTRRVVFALLGRNLYTMHSSAHPSSISLRKRSELLADQTPGLIMEGRMMDTHP
jgi:hypothetical protein